MPGRTIERLLGATQGHLARARRALEHLRWRELALRRERCPACGLPLLIKLENSEMGVRCPRCGASAVALSLAEVVFERLGLGHATRAWEMSADGPLVRAMRKRFAQLATSEFFAGVASGTVVDGVRCENVEAPSWPDRAFDLVTSTEVFEHVADDARGFAQVRRVLAPGGWFAFTVPLSGRHQTVERTMLRAGERVPLLAPAYHSDRRQGRQILVYRDYGFDIAERLAAAGFAEVELLPPTAKLFGHGRAVIVARK